MAEETMSTNFIHSIIEEELKPGGRCEGKTVHTRFPPEPNGYLHIGHCKALTIDFGTAEKFGGICNLRMDDTNPAKEDTEYVDAIQQDIHWLGFDWGDRFFYGSDYFEQTYELAVDLIKQGLAYVCELTPDQFKAYRGDTTTPAQSPWRDRPIEESLDLFQRMKNGEFPEGKYTLRAKIDLASGNFNMRDPVLYRIRYIEHHRQGTKWCIFPMYDFAHPIQDALEGITHSLCSLEYENHRPLYDWVVDHCKVPSKPRQIEFARLGINYTVMSKRKLRALVEEGRVDGWDDPRMPTLCGLRRRGYTPKSIRNFCERIGVSKVDSTVDWAFLESLPAGGPERDRPAGHGRAAPGEADHHQLPGGPAGDRLRGEQPRRSHGRGAGACPSPATSISRPTTSWRPLSPSTSACTPGGQECRLKGAYLIRCTGCVKDEAGNVVEVLCEYDPESKGGNPADGRKVKGATIHWVEADTAADAEVRLYDALFSDPAPDGPDKNFLDYLNPESLQVLTGCKVEQGLAQAAMPEAGKTATSYQFMRQGYFCLDNRDAQPGHLVFNRSVSLKDSFKKK